MYPIWRDKEYLQGILPVYLEVFCAVDNDGDVYQTFADRIGISRREAKEIFYCLPYTLKNDGRLFSRIVGESNAVKKAVSLICRDTDFHGDIQDLGERKNVIYQYLYSSEENPG